MTQVLTPRRELAAVGKIFTGNAAAAGAILPIFSATAQKFGIWNPAGSGVLAEIISVRMTYVGTNAAAGGYVLAHLSDAPANLATAARITAFTEGTPLSSLMGEGPNAKVKFAPAVATVTAPVIGRHLGINQDASLVAGAVQQANGPIGDNFEDGEVLLPPGNALFIAGNISTLVVWACGITWGEHDYTP